MTDIQTAIRENFTAEHIAHLRSNARYLEASIAIAERNADAAEWEVELWTERGNTVAATRHAWAAAYHRAAADFMLQLTVEEAKPERVLIQIHQDLDLFDGDCNGPYDAPASLGAYTALAEKVLMATYPSATVQTSFSTRTGGASRLTVLNDEGNIFITGRDAYSERSVYDRVLNTLTAVHAGDHGEWRMSANGGAL